MPWFKRLFGIVGGCSRPTLQNNNNRGVVMTSSFSSTIIRCRTATVPLSSSSSSSPQLMRFSSESGWQQLRTIHSDHPSAATLHRRSFWTTRGGGGDNDSDNDDDPDGGVDNNDDPRTITLTYRQSFLNNPTATYPVCVCTAQGLRSYMEDEYFYSQDGEFAAVFDGHGGQAVSRYLRKNLYANVQAFLPSSLTPGSSGSSSGAAADDENASQDNNNESSSSSSSSSTKLPFATLEDYEHAIVSAIEKVDREVQRISHWSYQGSTAVAVWLHQDRSASSSSQTTIVTANVGDSRAVLSRNGTAYDLSKDHKPDDPEEEARIEALGGKVVWCGDVDLQGNPIPEEGIYRVNGNLALSRAVGDRSERPHVVADPDITFHPVQEGNDNFIIVATDGLWDVFDSEDAVEFVTAMREEGHELERIATLMVEEALRRGTYDNITVLIIWLDETSDDSSGKSLEQDS